MNSDLGSGELGPSLLCRVGERLCAFPLAEVAETMRPLPVEPLVGAPAFVAGVAVIRGAAVPVVNATRLFGGVAGTPTRFVTVRTGDRLVALAVDAVIGVRWLGGAAVQTLPPLLREAGADVVGAVGSLDERFLMVLRGARLVPPGALDALMTDGGAP